MRVDLILILLYIYFSPAFFYILNFVYFPSHCERVNDKKITDI